MDSHMQTDTPPHGTSDVVICRLTESDIEAGDALYRLAFRAAEGRRVELGRYLRLQPEGWWLARRGGTPIGMGGALDYGSFAYVGMMAVHPACQRQGIGQALLDHLIRWLEARGVPAILLDATEAGAPLYEQFGFLGEDEARLFRASVLTAGASSDVERAQPADLEAVRTFDAPIFGADRLRVLRALLEEFPERFLVTRARSGDITGFIVAQPRRLGPWVARDAETAERLLRAALALPLAGPPTVIAPSANSDAQALLTRCGFNIASSTRHMRRGILPRPRKRSQIYGQESFAIG